MPALDFPALLRPVSEARPSGENLEYNLEFGELERAALGKPEQRMGAAVVPAEPPDFAQVDALAQALLARTKDLRVAAHLVASGLELRGFAGLAEGLELVASLLSTFWPSVHPELDPDDDNDATMRVSALSSLVAPPLLLAVRAAPLLASRLGGSVSLRQIAIAAGELPPDKDGTKVDPRTLESVLRQAELSAVQALDADLGRARAQVKAIGATFQAKAGISGPDLSGLDRLLFQARSFVGPRLAAEGAAAGAGGSETAPEGGSTGSGAVGDEAGTPGAAGFGGASRMAGVPVGRPSDVVVRSRDDVLQLLGKIREYYDVYEPSSPLPLLIARCERLCNLSFKDIIKDLTPSAIKELDVIVGKDAGAK